MAFGFGRKKDASADNQAAGPSGPGAAAPPPPPVKMKKRKANEKLSSVIKESTEGAAVALMRSNDRFLTNGGRTAVILLLDVSTIGGLSQKQRGDEAKGSIIELIQADQIATVATAGMLEEDVFGIIPTRNTVERMDEYEILAHAPYVWGTVDLATFSIAEGRPATFAVAKQVSEGTLTVDRALGGVPAMSAPFAPDAGGQSDEIDYDDPQDEVVPAPAGAPYAPAAAAAVGEESPFDDPEDIDYGDLEDEESGFDDRGVDPDDVFDPDEDYGDDAGQDEDGDGDYVDDGDDDVVDEDDYADDAGSDGYEPDDREVSEIEVHDTIARRYLSGDLGLEVDLAPFEHYLGTHEPISLFSEEADVDDWLGNQIAQMAKQANADIEAHHQRGIAELRQQYLALMSMHVESVTGELDTESGSTMYGALKQAALDDHKARLVDADRIASARKKEILDRFEAELKERAEHAAQSARVQYKDRHQARVDRELSEVSAQVLAQNDDVLAQQQEQLLANRRVDAGKRMDLGMNRILEALGERHRLFIEGEERLYREHSARMQAFLDDHRKEDLARSHALQEKLAREDDVKRAGEEYAQRMDALRAEHRSEVDRLRESIDLLHAKAREEMSAAENRWRGLLEVEQGNTKSATERANEIANRLSMVSADTERQYQDRLAALNQDRERAIEEADRATKVNDRVTKLMVAIAMLMAFLALAIGILIGAMWMNSRGGGAMVLPTFTIPSSSLFDGTAAAAAHWLAAIPSSTQMPA